MTALPAPPFTVLDESAQTFIASFMSNVVTVAGDGRERIPTIARVETLLLTAVANGEGASSHAWRALHRAITELVMTPEPPIDRSDAHVYLRSFVRENGDLAQI